MKQTRSISPQALDSVRILGTEIARARRERRWTAAELAERAGISVITLRKVEQGAPTVAIGIVFELASLLGITLLDDADRLPALVQRGRDRLSLLPSRVREVRQPVRDDF